MKAAVGSFVRSSVILMLRPIVRFCLTRGLHVQDFIEVSKKVFVDTAVEIVRNKNDELSVSKLSVMTGIQRPEIKRLLETSDIAQEKSKDFVSRIIGQWSADRRFKKGNAPKKLTIEGANSEFANLVQLVGSDLSSHTVRYELERLGLIQVKAGYVTLISPAYVTKGDPTSTLRLGAQDVSDLITSIQENAFTEHHVANLQARTEYDNIPDEKLIEIREWLLKAGGQFHKRMRNYLSKYDRDITKSKKLGNGRNRIVVGTYSLVEAFTHKKHTS